MKIANAKDTKKLAKLFAAYEVAVEKLREDDEKACEALVEAATDFQERIREILDDIDLGPYEQAREELVDALADLGSEAQDGWANAGEKWQESDAGETFSERAERCVDAFSLFPELEAHVEPTDAVNAEALTSVIDGLTDVPASLEDLDLGLELP